MKHQSHKTDKETTESGLFVRESNRQSLVYKSNKDIRKWIICNGEKCVKGLLIPLRNIFLKRIEGKFSAEKTLKELLNFTCKI